MRINMRRIQIIAAFTVMALSGCGRADSSTAKGDVTNEVIPSAKVEASATNSQNALVLSAASPVTVMGTEAAARQTNAEVYREVKDEDGIRFYSRCQSWGFYGGNFHADGVECGVIGDDGKEIRIELISTTEDHGQIQTKECGIIKQSFNQMIQTPDGGTLVMPSDDNIQASGSGDTSNVTKLFATESQIKRLRALQIK